MDHIRITRAEIDLSALKHNLEAVRARIGPGVRVMGIVKANAYGHGTPVITQALVRFGIDYLGVSVPEEGIELRHMGIQCPIIILSGVFLHQVEGYFHYNLDITVPSLELARAVDDAAHHLTGKRKPKIHLNIDTGMGRLGTRYEHAREFIEQALMLKHLDIVGIYSHFATADEADKAYANGQLAKFNGVLDIVKQKGAEIPLIHMANSGAILDLPESYFTMVRPGILLYGVYPSEETSSSVTVRPVMTLKSKVNFIKEVPAGTSIGYGRCYTTTRRTTIVTVPIGYGDGYNRRFSNKSPILINGKRYIESGSVSMDQILADVGPDSDIRLGDDVVLIGRQGNEEITSHELARLMGTIPYEIYTSITERVPRIPIHDVKE